MHLSAISSAQKDTAALVAKWVRENTIGYGAVTSEVGLVGAVGVPVVAIARNGSTTCTAKVAVHRNRIVYVSELGTHITYPTNPEDAGRIVGGFLSLEES